MFVDISKLEALRERNLITMQKLDGYDLYIWNYTPRCQFHKENWNDETRMCRGLITDADGLVYARPFPKFFNLSEHEGETSWLPKLNWQQNFICTKKMDGSLGILYTHEEESRIATRGSFKSEQAIRATEISKKYDFSWLDTQGFTYLFEIIYPGNRIVLDYKGMEELILLDVIDIESGKSVDWQSLQSIAHRMRCPCVEQVLLSTHEVLKPENMREEENEEGYVIKFEDGTRVKVKFEEYVRLHRLICGVNAKTIWEHLRWGTGFEELLDTVPDEFNDWVRKIVAELSDKYEAIENGIEKAWGEIIATSYIDALNNNLTMHEAPRRVWALEILKYPDMSNALFQKLDGKKYDKFIWQKIKPKASLPFHNDIDA